MSERERFVKKLLFEPPGVDPEEVTDKMIVPGSNIALGPYAGHSQIKMVEFVNISGRAKDCPKDKRPEFAILGWSNVGKSSLINVLVQKNQVALSSKKQGSDPALFRCDITHSFARASDAAQTDWSSYTKGYCLNRDALVAVLLLIDASVPPQRIDLDCANWLGRYNCDKMKASKGRRPDENIRDFQELIRENYKQHPPWMMTSSVTALGREELLLHISQLRNYWDQ